MRLSFLVFTFFICFFQVQSQDFEVIPVDLQFEVEPGNSESQKITIINHAAKETSFTLELFDRVVEGEEIVFGAPLGSTPNSISDWISINPQFFVLRPNEKKDVNVTLTAPSNDPESKFGDIYVRVSKERGEYDADKNISTGILVSPRIKVSVSQISKSNPNLKGKILSLRNVTTKQDEVNKFEIKIENKGGSSFTAKIYMIIADITTGKEMKEPAVSRTLLPNQIKTVDYSTTKKLAPGDYAVAVILDYSSVMPLEIIQQNIVIE